MIHAYGFDVDGCLARADWRNSYLEKEPVNWDAYHTASQFDEPYEEMAGLVRMIRNYGDLWKSDITADNMIYILTARPEKFRSITSDWLRKHYIPHDFLWMRPDHDLRSAHVIKAEWLIKLGKNPDQKVELVFDDSSKVVEAMQKVGIGQICQVNHRHNFDKY